MRPRTVPSFYTFSQMVLLCQSPDPDSATGCRDRAILALLCSTGLRASELCGLRVHDFKGDRLFVHRGKFGHQRWVPISKPASRALHRYLAEHPPADRLGPVFRCVKGRGLTRRRLHKIVTGYWLLPATGPRGWGACASVECGHALARPGGLALPRPAGPGSCAHRHHGAVPGGGGRWAGGGFPAVLGGVGLAGRGFCGGSGLSSSLNPGEATGGRTDGIHRGASGASRRTLHRLCRAES